MTSGGMAEIDGVKWRSYDYREEVPMSVELAGLLGCVDVGEEKRQCVTKVLAAAALWRQTDRPPTMEEVRRKATAFRVEQAQQAVEAVEVMGKAAARVSSVEYELRGYAHDILKAHHDRDYRSLAASSRTRRSSCSALTTRGTMRWRRSRAASGASAYLEGAYAASLPAGCQDSPGCRGGRPGDGHPNNGLPLFWQQRVDQPPVAPGDPPCRLCRPPRRAGREGAWQPKAHSCLAALALADGAEGPPAPVRMVDGKKLVLRELFAGRGVLTAAWIRHGGHALTPVELYTAARAHAPPMTSASAPTRPATCRRRAGVGPISFGLPRPAPGSVIGRSTIRALALSPPFWAGPRLRPGRWWGTPSLTSARSSSRWR